MPNVKASHDPERGLGTMTPEGQMTNKAQNLNLYFPWSCHGDTLFLSFPRKRESSFFRKSLDPCSPIKHFEDKFRRACPGLDPGDDGRV